MSDHASTSSSSSFDILNCSPQFEKLDPQELLQHALSQAGQKRAEKMGNGGGQMKSPRSPPVSRKTDIRSIARIKEHPLFPILRLLSTKCDLAVHTMEEKIFNMDDVRELFSLLQSQGVSPKTEDLELDSLITDAILVLRMQLVEIEKVSRYAEDFRMKYMIALKKRMSHEALIGMNMDSDDEGGNTSDGEIQSQGGLVSSSNTTVAMMSTPNGTVSIPLTIPSLMIRGDSTREETIRETKRARFDFTSIENCDLSVEKNREINREE